MAIPTSGTAFRLVLVISLLCLLAVAYLNVDVRYHIPMMGDFMNRRGGSMNRTLTFQRGNTTTLNWTHSGTSLSTQQTQPNSHPPPTVKSNATYYKPLSRGHYIKVGTKDIAIVTAVYHPYKPEQNSFNIFLNGWAHIQPDLTFKCCIFHKIDSKDDLLLEIPAKKYHLYIQWKVDMQNAEFSCSIPKSRMRQLRLQHSLPQNEPLKYITFVETTKSCKMDAPREVIPIEYRKTIPNSVGICLKITYGTVDVELMVEWFEYQRLMGVTKVFTFLAEDLDDDARKVFQYYVNIGFAETNPIYPAPKNNGTHRGFRRPRWEQQAWVDEVMAINDCKHRMAGLDWVIIHDMDEWIVPHAEGDNIVSIFKKASQQFPNAGAFQLNAHAAILNWGYTRSSPLNVMRTTNLTTFANYDGADRNARFAWNSDRIFCAKNNLVFPTKGHPVRRLPGKLYTLVHRRFCKPKWLLCNRTEIRSPDLTIVRYETQLIQNIQKVPLDSILSDSTNYIRGIRKWLKDNLLLE